MICGVRIAYATSLSGRDVQWDLWNEPDYCGFWESHRSRNQYLEMWKRFYLKVRAVIPNAIIVGLSTSWQPGEKRYSDSDFY